MHTPIKLRDTFSAQKLLVLSYVIEHEIITTLIQAFIINTVVKNKLHTFLS